MLLCLRPEQWPEQARYPFKATFLPLLAVILLSSLLTGISSGLSAMAGFRQFAANYDKYYVPMLLANDQLSLASPPLVSPSSSPPSATTATSAPATAPSTPLRNMVRLKLNDLQFIIDPTGTVSRESLEDTNFLYIGSQQIIQNLGPFHMESSIKDFRETSASNPAEKTLFHLFFPPIFSQPWRLDTPNLQKLIRDHGSPITNTIITLNTCAALLRNLLWSLAMIFFATPFVNMGCLQLRMPRRIAYRITAAVLVPLVLLDGLMDILNAAPRNILGGEYTLWLWLIATSILALWAGIMANRMYRRIVIK